MKAKFAGLIVVITLFVFSFLVQAQVPVPECGGDSGVDFRIATDKLVYAPDSMMHVKFLITNTKDVRGQDMLYLDRTLGYCSSQMGYYALTILDNNNRQVPMQGCAGDAVMEKVDAVELFTNPKTGIALKLAEVFGSDNEFQLPAKRGKYRLRAELFTGWLLKKQLLALAQRHMRILPQGCTVTAPVVTITVR